MNQRIDGDDTSGPVAAADVTAIPTPPLTGTNVQDQLDEIAVLLTNDEVAPALKVYLYSNFT